MSEAVAVHSLTQRTREHLEDFLAYNHWTCTTRARTSTAAVGATAASSDAHASSSLVHPSARPTSGTPACLLEGRE